MINHIAIPPKRKAEIDAELITLRVEIADYGERADTLRKEIKRASDSGDYDSALKLHQRKDQLSKERSRDSELCDLRCLEWFGDPTYAD